ncbi:hypothetical protein H1R20_g598, partial [Candolleomyces eurysporus]
MASEAYYPSSSSPSSYNVSPPFAYVDQPPQPPNRHQPEEEFSAADVGPVHFQMPDFLYATAPALASGGGAEVLPAGMLNQTNWLVNNGFSPAVNHGKQKQIEVWHDSPTYNAVDELPPSRGAFDFDEMPVRHIQSAAVQLSVPSPTHPGATSAGPLFSPFQLDQFMSQHQAQSQSDGQQQQQRPPFATKPSPSAIPDLVPAATRFPLPLPSLTTAPAGIIQPVYYSATGFDILSILARVYSRPYPRIKLGPVDLTCSFVVVDVRRHDNPIVYCSPSFCKLTGYDEREVLGRNCRFLQSSRGVMEQGGEREDEETRVAVRYLKKCLVADKECQTTIVNYRKDGTPFRNLLTVIPIPGGVSGNGTAAGGEGGEGLEGEQDVVFHVGFQVDLTEQPKVIFENMKQGSYLVDHYPPSMHPGHHPGASTSNGIRQAGQQTLASRDRKNGQNFPQVLMSKELKRLLSIPAFLKAIPITTKTNIPVPNPSSGSSSSALTTGTAVDTNELLRTYGGNNPIHMILLELGPDFVHVVSLKGSFLYVAPSVRRVLGYEPEELVGASFADLAHPEDLVPLMRELKESSTSSNLGANSGPTGGVVPGTALTSVLGEPGISTAGQQHGSLPRNVSLMFRAKAKNGTYVWVESRGRLHVEPGKGRKAIILTGRAREMGNRPRRYPQSSDGSTTVVDPTTNGEVEDVVVRQEFWGVVSTSMVVMNVGSGIRDVLGFSPEEFTGKKFEKLLMEPSALLKSHFKSLGKVGEGEYDAKWASVKVRMKLQEGFVPLTRLYGTTVDGGAGGEDGEHERSVEVVVNVFRMQRDPAIRHVTQLPGGISPAHLIYQVRVASAEVHDFLPTSPIPSSSAESPSSSLSYYHPHSSTSPSSSSPSHSATSPSTSSTTAPPTSGENTPAPVDIKSNLFEALDISKGSSWQYELQQLKYGNQKLREEVLALTAAIRAKKAREQREAQRVREEAAVEQQRELEARVHRQRVMAMHNSNYNIVNTHTTRRCTTTQVSV